MPQLDFALVVDEQRRDSSARNWHKYCKLQRAIRVCTISTDFPTMHGTMLNKLIVAAALAVCSGLYAADASNPPPSSAKPAADSATKSAAGEIKKDKEKFNSERDRVLAEHQALMNQLKNATDEQRKAILEKMKEIGDAQR